MEPRDNRYRILRLAVPFVVLVAVLAETRSASPTASVGSPVGGSDEAFYHAIVRRVHAGEPYYPVVADELRSKHYPSASLFNWRTPFLSLALAFNPSLGHALFAALVTVVLIGMVGLLAREALPITIAGAFAASGALMVIFDPGVWVFHEVWAGCFLAISVFAYDREFHVPGFLAGVCALFIRELAAPYVLLCLAVAVTTRRRQEAVAWIGAIMTYGMYYAMHSLQVLAHQAPGDIVQTTGWLTVGGLSFVADTLRTNSLLHSAPTSLRAIVLAVLVSALVGRSLALRLRLTVAVYFAFFFFVGQEFNWYWGWMIGFLVPVVFAHGLSEVLALLRQPDSAG